MTPHLTQKMVKTTLDSIVRSLLLEKGLSIHFYIQYLVWGLDCLKELNLDIVGKIKSRIQTVDDFSSIALPVDYIDWVRVGVKNGQYVQELGQNNTFNRLLNTNSAGTLTAYPEPDTSFEDIWLLEAGMYVETRFNDYGEFTGRWYGSGEGARSDTFQVIEEDERIQLNTDIKSGSKIVLDYIYFDSANSDTSLPKYSEATIKSYIEYQFEKSLPKGKIHDVESAKKEYYNQLRILRARAAGIRPLEVARIFRREFKQSPRL